MNLGLHYRNLPEPRDVAKITTTLVATAELAEQQGRARQNRYHPRCVSGGRALLGLGASVRPRTTGALGCRSYR